MRSVLLYTTMEATGGQTVSARAAGDGSASNGSGPPRTSRVIRGADLPAVEGHPSEPGRGASVTELLTNRDGAVHLGVAVVELAPGARIDGHLHPFEESFYVLSGRVLVNLAGTAFDLSTGDFGVVPVAHGHAWHNNRDEPARLLRVYAPQPRPMDGRAPFGVYAAEQVAAPTEGHTVVELDPRHRLVGHFGEEDIPQPGPLLMPGYHGKNIRNVSIRMMVDELLGARHHTLFVVQFASAADGSISAKEHFHPFEEMYYFVAGQAAGFFDGERVEVGVGDLVFAPVGGSHGFTSIGDRPVRWIEAQAPLPPPSDGFYFHSDWAGLEALG
jgi:mannose-6-phosphate isomerase-like protein (cupin superfamily)